MIVAFVIKHLEHGDLLFLKIQIWHRMSALDI